MAAVAAVVAAVAAVAAVVAAVAAVAAAVAATVAVANSLVVVAKLKKTSPSVAGGSHAQQSRPGLLLSPLLLPSLPCPLKC